MLADAQALAHVLRPQHLLAVGLKVVLVRERARKRAQEQRDHRSVVAGEILRDDRDALDLALHLAGEQLLDIVDRSEGEHAAVLRHRDDVLAAGLLAQRPPGVLAE